MVLASDAQLIGARTLCGPMKELSMDSNHGLNSYNLKMTTLMTIYEHGDGYPIALCYSSRVDIQIKSVFLRVIKALIWNVVDKTVLMIDDTEVYSNAWNAIIGNLLQDYYAHGMLIERGEKIYRRYEVILT